MSKNIIFVFSGTGNSLWVARKISEDLGNCKIVSMGKKPKGTLKDGYDSIGFVFPTYACGIPKRVKKFIEDIDFGNNLDAYFFGVSTCGSVPSAPSSITQLGHLLGRKGVALNYGERIAMFSNCVTLYDMKEESKEKNELAVVDLVPIMERIRTHKDGHISKIPNIGQIVSQSFQLGVSQMDRGFKVSDKCISCGICKRVCPVGNIKLNKNGKPRFAHHCEQCVACIQNCPTKAINFMNKTQTRGRYMHPEITWKDLATLNGYTMKETDQKN